MPVTHQWFLPGRVIYIRWSGYLTEEDLPRVNARTIEFLNAGQAPVHLIRDDSAVTGMPPASLSQLVKTVRSTQHPAMGWALTIGKSNPYIAPVVDLYCKVMRVRYRRAQDINTAVEFLQQIDPTLDFSQADYRVTETGS